MFPKLSYIINENVALSPKSTSTPLQTNRTHLIPYTTDGTIHTKQDRKTSSVAEGVILLTKATSKASIFGYTIFTRKRGRTLP
jgi:hypothetical protein